MAECLVDSVRIELHLAGIAQPFTVVDPDPTLRAIIGIDRESVVQLCRKQHPGIFGIFQTDLGPEHAELPEEQIVIARKDFCLSGGENKCYRDACPHRQYLPSPENIEQEQKYRCPHNQCTGRVTAGKRRPCASCATPIHCGDRRSGDERTQADQEGAIRRPAVRRVQPDRQRAHGQGGNDAGGNAD
ncbi:Rieske 2Fe-2S domain-containing protein [Paraburkholderia diazotrophica]|uniref:Rieske 2Fe-2S domain-containing protein n=1 Tax=Paraburkholderia diazotrophica TaxID=667676 RepID=UPI00115FF718